MEKVKFWVLNRRAKNSPTANFIMELAVPILSAIMLSLIISRWGTNCEEVVIWEDYLLHMNTDMQGVTTSGDVIQEGVLSGECSEC